MGWFVPKSGCKYDTSSEAGAAKGKKFGFVYVYTLPYASATRMKRLINPRNKT